MSGRLTQKSLVRRYLDEKTKSEIHVSGVKTEIATCIRHSDEHDYSPDNFLSVWLPDALRLTMARQKGVASLLNLLKSPAGKRLIGNEPIKENARFPGITPRLVDLAGGGQQGHRDLFIEVMENLTADLDDLATNIRKTINEIESERPGTE